MSDQEPKPERPKLRCLGGREVPAGVLADLAKLRALPPAAKRELWDVLGPTLPEPIPAAASSAIETFRVKHAIDGAELAIGVKACRYLVREASRYNLAAPEFSEDLAALDGGSGELAELLLGAYEVAKATVRDALVRRALVRHGQVLVDVEWRVDTMAASNEVRGMRVPIAVLTLRHVEGGQPHSTTLQVPASMLRKLREICNVLLGDKAS
jgi:hypothetical protein